MDQTQGLVACSHLTEGEIAAMQALAQVVRQSDGLAARLDAAALRQRSSAETSVFLYYQTGRLVGYLDLYGFGAREREVESLVHPAWRRRGIFRALVSAAVDACRQRGVLRLLFICERPSAAGQAAVTAVGGKYTYSEYSMTFCGPLPRLTFDPRLQVQPAGAESQPLLTHLIARSFGDPEEVAQSVVAFNLEQPQRFPYVAWLDKEPVGTMTLVKGDCDAYIAGLGVLPEWRGRGYGRQILATAVQLAQAEGREPILLDVETDNQNALGLYRSCGFKEDAVYDYYTLNLA